MEGDGLGKLITGSVPRLADVFAPPFNSQVIYEITLVFCAGYEDGTSASRELH